MIKPASQYNAPFEIEYDILKKLDDIENSGLLVSGSSNTPCTCSNDNTDIITALYEIKTSIENKDITKEIIREYIIERPVETIKEVVKEVVKEVEVVKNVYVEKPVEKIVVKKIYIEKPIGNCNCNHCNHNTEHVIYTETGGSNSVYDEPYLVHVTEKGTKYYALDRERWEQNLKNQHNTTDKYINMYPCWNIKRENPNYKFQPKKKEITGNIVRRKTF